jgi:hypothetical protein
MNISISIPFYNYNLTDSVRYEITKKNIQHYCNIQHILKKEGLNIYLNLVGSENDLSFNLCKPFLTNMVKYTEFRQVHNEKIKPEDLRAKYNFCFQQARDYWGEICTFHCISGSNDFVSILFFEELLTHKDFYLLGVSANRNKNNLIVLDYLNKKGFCSTGAYEHTLFHFQNNFIGGFYALKTNLLGLLNYNPFQFNDDELGLEKYCLDQQIRLHMIDCEILNVKSNMDLNTYNDCEILKKTDLAIEDLNSYFSYLNNL